MTVLAIIQLHEGEFVPDGVRVERLVGEGTRYEPSHAAVVRVFTVLVEETMMGAVENYLRRRGR